MKCENCKKYDDCRNGSGLVWPCGAYSPAVVTRADRIRAMTDKELATDLLDMIFELCEDGVPATDYVLSWLRETEQN